MSVLLFAAVPTSAQPGPPSTGEAIGEAAANSLSQIREGITQGRRAKVDLTRRVQESRQAYWQAYTRGQAGSFERAYVDALRDKDMMILFSRLMVRIDPSGGPFRTSPTLTQAYNRMTGPPPDDGIFDRALGAYNRFFNTFTDALLDGKTEEELLLSSDYWSGGALVRAFQASEADYEAYRSIRNEEERWLGAHLLYNDAQYTFAYELLAPLVEANHPGAAHLLGIMYLKGHGVEASDEKAREYILRAARGGDVRAQVDVGNLYKTGESLFEQDLNKAHYWYERAANQGHNGASEKLEHFRFYLKQPAVDYHRARTYGDWTAIADVNGTEVALKMDFRYRKADDTEVALLWINCSPVLWGGCDRGRFIPALIEAGDGYELSFWNGYGRAGAPLSFSGRLSSDARTINGVLRHPDWGSDAVAVELSRAGDVPEVEPPSWPGSRKEENGQADPGPRDATGDEAFVPAPTEQTASDVCSGGVTTVADTPPELVGGVQSLMDRLTYPTSAQGSGTQGRVFLQFVVGPAGQVMDIEVTRGLGPAFDREAIRALREAEFRPGRVGDEPACVQMSLPFTFRR